MVIIDTINHSEAIYAINKSLDQIEPQATLFFTDIPLKVAKTETILISNITSKEEYSQFVLVDLYAQIQTYANRTSQDFTHVLIIQSDGFVLNGEVWDNIFMTYDYVGAPWQYDGRNVGNGGFSLRSMKLMKAVGSILYIEDAPYLGPEDEVICRLLRGVLETAHKISFAPEKLAEEFSFELLPPKRRTFGFHGYFHKPYVKPVVIKRTGGLGDVVLCEPVLRAFFKMGRKVYLDSPFYDLYQKHFFPVYHASELVEEEFDYFNLDMAYEVRQPMNYVEAYFEACMLPKELITKPQLKFNSESGRGMFSEPYVVVDLKKRPEAYRNPEFDHYSLFKEMNYETKTVILLDAPEYLLDIHEDIDLTFTIFRPENIQMLMYLLKYATSFIGIDSGPSHVARALGTPIRVASGSVNLDFVHVEYNNSEENMSIVNHEACTLHCWHVPNGTSGQECLLSGIENLKCVRLLK